MSDLLPQLPALRSSVAAFTADFASLLRRIDVAGGGTRSMLPRDEHTQLSKTLVEYTLTGCRLMSDLSSLLREAMAFKCNHMCPDELLIQRTRGAVSVESVCDYGKMPKECNVHCAENFLPFWSGCNGLLATQAQVFDDLSALAAKCSAAMEAEGGGKQSNAGEHR